MLRWKDVSLGTAMPAIVAVAQGLRARGWPPSMRWHFAGRGADATKSLPGSHPKQLPCASPSQVQQLSQDNRPHAQLSRLDQPGSLRSRQVLVSLVQLLDQGQKLEVPGKGPPLPLAFGADPARRAAILALENIDNYSHASSFGRSSLITPRATP